MRRRNLRNVRVDDLGKGELAAVRHKVKALRLNASRLHGMPFQVVPGDLGVRGSLGLLSDRLDGLGAVDRLLGTGDIGQTAGKFVRGLRPAYSGGSMMDDLGELWKYSRRLRPLEHGERGWGE